MLNYKKIIFNYKKIAIENGKNLTLLINIKILCIS